MIESILGRIPTKLVDHTDFPDIAKYFSYICSEIPGANDYADKHGLSVSIVDTPYRESFILSSETEAKVVFDIGYSLTLITLSQCLVRGQVTNELLEKLLETAAGALLAKGNARVSLVFSLRNLGRTEDEFMNSIDNAKHVLLELTEVDGPNYGAKQKISDRIEKADRIDVSEFFLLGHEVTHFLIDKGLLGFDNIIDTLREDFLEDGYLALSERIFFQRLFGETNKNDEFSKFRSLLNTESFKAELTCDVIAIELAFEYFTWDAKSLEHGVVGNAVRVCFRSMLLLEVLKERSRNTILKNEDEESSSAIEIFLRAKFIDAIVSKKIFGHHPPEVKWEDLDMESEAADFFTQIFKPEKPESIMNRVFAHDIEGYETIRKRTAVVETIVIPHVLNEAQLCSQRFEIVEKYFSYPEEASIYYLGYDTKFTYGQEFMRSDGTAFARDEALKATVGDMTRTVFAPFSQAQKQMAQEILSRTII